MKRHDCVFYTKPLMALLKFQWTRSTINLLHLHPPERFTVKICYYLVAELTHINTHSPATTIRRWNTLPGEVINSRSLQSFKQLL